MSPLVGGPGSRVTLQICDNASAVWIRPILCFPMVEQHLDESSGVEMHNVVIYRA